MLDWRLRGSCRDEDPDLFFPEKARVNSKDVIAAKRICDGCPVSDDCLQNAGDDDGIRGGLTKKERKSLNL